MNRRNFLTSSLAAGAALGSGVLVSAQTTPAPVPAGAAKAAPATRPPPKPPLEPTLARDFVGASHANLPKVKDLLRDEPMLINAVWDWGAGDWETGLGAASHVGNRELALHLLDHGARFDAFCAAMFGETATVTAMLRFKPTLANTPGPHGYTLLYHVGYCGDVALAEAVGTHLTAANRPRHFNQALQTTVLRGHTDLVAFMLKHGVDDPNTKNFQGKTSLDVAIAKRFEAIEKLLRIHGGVTTG